ncbi:lipid II:glycine glycyltransferase FemX [Ornithinimicrobium sp. LYQ121]|uniref:lipid II:glycine glycyltransferase FemX n=1 Tax=Ornithinimicrobium sp. LYQ121 TaxID=3378801 RepID=UPI0038543FFD
MVVGRTCDEQTPWDDAITDLGGHPLQLWGWGELKTAYHWGVQRVLFRNDEDTVVGAAQILVRPLPGPFRRLDYVPRGPVWKDGYEKPVLDALRDHCAQELPGTLISIEPDTETTLEHEGWKHSTNTILIPQTLILDLTRTEDELLADAAKKTRQYIRKSGREGLEIRRVTAREDLAAILGVYHETASRAGFALHDDAYYYDVHDKLGDASVVFAAYQDDLPLAFVWLAASARTAFELYGGMNTLGQSLRANYALKWHAITSCKEQGISLYDMNGLLNDGVSTFKRGFASHETELAGTYDYPLSPLYTVWAKGLPSVKRVVQKARSLRQA